MQGYLNNGVNDPSRDFREELTELMKERISHDIGKLVKENTILRPIKFTYDITVAECPVGWDVEIIFEKDENISHKLWIAETIAKTIGVPFSAKEVEFEECDEAGFFNKLTFCADLVPYRELD